MLFRLPPPDDAERPRRKVVANASLALSAVSIAVYLWGYTFEERGTLLHPGIMYFSAGWLGFWISLVLSIVAVVALREGTRAKVAFYVAVWGVTLPWQLMALSDFLL
jgi:hypothetical protein